jgi:pimeloyl-ACP methyl ester carboxylesterase
MPARAWQVKFKTTDNLGHATATVSTVMVPTAAWSGSGPRPVVSYQTAEDGVDTKCSPSYALSAGAAALPGNSESETGLMRLALMRGWVVTAPDYEGPDSQFLGEQMSAHGVLDGLRATLAFKPAGINRRAPLALWGYSGGSLASAWAAQRQPAWAPDLKLSGVALGGVVGDIKATLLDFNGGPGGGAVPMGLSGVDRAYPQANVLQYLTDAGRQTVAAAAHDCIADAVARHPFWNIAQYGARPGVIDEPGPTQLLSSISPATMSTAPTGPVYMYTTQDDEFAPLPAALKLAARWCGAGVRVQQVTDPPSDHITETVVGAPAAMSYLADRFAGKPAPSTC